MYKAANVVCQGIIPCNTPPRPEVGPGPWRGQTVRYIHSPTELSWSRPRRGQTVRYIHSPTKLSWSRPRSGQTVRYIHSPIELSWSRPRRGQTASEIHSFSNWAIMIQATERTDSEIHSYYHWAIRIQATERTDSEIHLLPPLSHHGPGYGEDRQWDTFILIHAIVTMIFNFNVWRPEGIKSNQNVAQCRKVLNVYLR